MSDQPSPGPSRRQAARLAAVQALYQWQEGEHAPAEIIEQFLKVRTGETGEGGMRRDADRPLFKDVVEGTVANKDALEQTVSAALAKDWTWARIASDPVEHRVDEAGLALIVEGVGDLDIFIDRHSQGHIFTV